MNREDFNMLKSGIIYFDNGATTLKPKILGEATNNYYDNYSVNTHRGDYRLSLYVDSLYDKTREKVKEFINASSSKEIVFTSNATDSLNKIIFGYYKNILKKDDEVIITKSEHASNVLPWYELKDEIGINIKYIDLSSDYSVTIESIEKTITDKTKVISLAHISNVIGDIRDIKAVSQIAHKNGIDVLVDASQSIAHMRVDVKELDVDFLVFSAHKMYGPTGVGVLYGKLEKLNNMKPIIFGGGMNASYSSEGVRIYSDIPQCFEAGTQNIAGVLGFSSVLDYLNNIGMDKIYNHENELREYAISRLCEIEDVTIYNKNSKSSIITFNYNGVFAQDLAIYLDKYNICLRAGNHCSKILKDEIGVKNTVRISFGLFNTKEEIDILINALKNKNLKNEII